MEERGTKRSRGKWSRKKQGGGTGRWAAVLFLIALAAGAVYVVMKFSESQSEKQPREESREVAAQTMENKRGRTGVEKAVDLEGLLKNMTVEEKILQLFVITPEALTGVDKVTAAGEATKKAYKEYPVGGLVYFNQNLMSYSQTLDMLTRMKTYSLDRTGVPAFLSVDEEGGTVARISGRDGFDIPALPDMKEVGASGDSKQAYETGKYIGGYLSELGFNLDFAPVADVLTNPENTVVEKRSFGTDGAMVAEFALAAAKGIEDQGVSACLKHFPGHGGTKGDTHNGYAYTEKTLNQLMESELLPFKKGAEEQVDFIMVGHIGMPVAGDSIPSSLSKKAVTGILRDQLGYQGIVITDALNMEAITSAYSSGDAALMALDAGVDMLLMPEDFKEAYAAIKSSVDSGRIKEERIDESVRRILEVKIKKR